MAALLLRLPYRMDKPAPAPYRARRDRLRLFK
jgi:hypothetical protein